VRRIYHHWETWECVPAGMYEEAAPGGMAAEDAILAYAAFLSDHVRFSAALERVVAEWPISCEHFLSNDSINRIAWLGQASMCIETGVPSKYKAGFARMTGLQRHAANGIAGHHLARYLKRRDGDQLCLPAM
jgi:hypothetical protein